MKPNRITVHWCLAILYVIIGAVLITCAEAHLIDYFWGTMGTVICVVGGTRIIRLIRYRFNPKFKEATDTSIADERNHFIRGKAWAWAGYLFIFAAAIATIVLKILGQDTLMLFCSGSICVLIIFYWIAYFILTRKY